MVSLEDIKRDLPTWPDDVIEEWLLRLANSPDTGWPPPDPLGWCRWTFLLCEKPVSWWRNVNWQLQSVDCGLQNLSSDTKSIVTKTYRAHFTGENNNQGGEDSYKRVKTQLQHLLAHGSFPKPPVAMKIDSGLYVLDGNHRMAAHYTSQQMPAGLLAKIGKQRPPCTQTIWIGKHNRGEVFEG